MLGQLEITQLRARADFAKMQMEAMILLPFKEISTGRPKYTYGPMTNNFSAMYFHPLRARRGLQGKEAGLVQSRPFNCSMAYWREKTPFRVKLSLIV